MSYINLPKYGFNKFLGNKYHRMWHTLAVGIQWVGHSCVTSVHFGLMYVQHCGCLLLSHDISGSLGTTLNLGYVKPPPGEDHGVFATLRAVRLLWFCFKNNFDSRFCTYIVLKYIASSRNHHLLRPIQGQHVPGKQYTPTFFKQNFVIPLVFIDLF